MKTETIEVDGKEAVGIEIESGKNQGRCMVVFPLDGMLISIPAPTIEAGIERAEGFLANIRARRELAKAKLEEANDAKARGNHKLAMHLHAEAVKLNGGKELEDL